VCVACVCVCKCVCFCTSERIAWPNQGHTQGRIKGFIPPKLVKLDLTTDAEYVVNLVNVDMWL